MKAVIGYLFAGVGLLGLALNSTIGREQLKFLENISSEYVLVPAVVCLVLGLFVMVMSSKGGRKIKHVGEEVPIYQGEGKKRRIVGYRTD